MRLCLRNVNKDQNKKVEASKPDYFSEDSPGLDLGYHPIEKGLSTYVVLRLKSNENVSLVSLLAHFVVTPNNVKSPSFFATEGALSAPQPIKKGALSSTQVPMNKVSRLVRKEKNGTWLSSHEVFNFPKRKVKNPLIPSPSQHPLFVMTLFSNYHAHKIILSSDVERNPGPGVPGDPGSMNGGRDAARQQQGKVQDLKVISYNVRGINEDAKLRHLVNYCYSQDAGKVSDSIFCFQETYISQAGKLPYLWRGNYHLTSGRGNSLGCLTLLSSHLNVVASRDIAERAHVIVLQKIGEPSVTYIVCNVYAPNLNNEEKITFFEQIFDTLLEFEQIYNCSNVIVLGDFNLVFKTSECKNRAFGRPEKLVANAVKGMIQGANLVDLWEAEPSFTWRRPGSDSFSAIDRFLYSKNFLTVEIVNVNWSLSFSDHAAIEVTLKKVANKNPKVRSKITRLDPSLMKDTMLKNKIIEGVEEMYKNHLPTWSPHLKLEFAKVCIRTVTEKVQADRKKLEKTEEDFVNYEIEISIAALQNRDLSQHDREDLIEHIEELRGRKLIFIEEKGKRLAEKLGTKWYNEGEKSTRYFLRLLNRSIPDDFVELVSETGERLVDEQRIETEIVKFYKALYEDVDDLTNANNDASFFDHLTEVDPAMRGEVTAPILEAELLSVLGTCKDSAPGPDGIPYSFISGMWHLLGPLIIDSWNYSQRVGSLAPSDKLSFLKLIPKAGKDLKKLTNWRPITLSNTDHKLITKTYAKRLSKAVESCIDERQTAYLKGRLISDNVRSLLSSIRLSNLEENIDGLIISLDAKKAFDSVSHSFIVRCLEKFGMGDFVPIFRILYKDLRSDVIINGKITEGYLIKRGVKQGDALSCVLFIMCMEPLLRNIEHNRQIRALSSTELNSELPKAYAYADDVNIVTCNNLEGVRAVFYEYERLTRQSGLELNANKTEILRITSRRFRNEILKFDVRYLDKSHEISTTNQVKINGILLQQDEQGMGRANLELVRQKIEANCKRWSSRRLSLLGKILIVKTFGISQIVYLMQCMVLSEADFKSLNAILYKFLWNRHFEAAKAPDRLPREIINTPVKLGGFGMLNIEELDKGLKLKALSRLFSTSHPFLSLIKNRLNLEEFFFPKLDVKLDPVSNYAVALLKSDRSKIWDMEIELLEAKAISLIRGIKLKSAVSHNGRNSIAYFNVRRAGCERLASLSRAQLDSLTRFMPKNLAAISKIAIAINVNQDTSMLNSFSFLRNKLTNIQSLSSKSIREGRANREPICIFKGGLINNPTETLTWSYKLSKLACTRHKNVLLRVAHREFYTKEKLTRYRLIDSPICARCDQVEDYDHKIFNCTYANKIWQEAFRLTDGIDGPGANQDTLSKIIGTSLNSNVASLTIHAEILNRIMCLRDDANHLLRPKVFVKLAVQHLVKREKSEELKRRLRDLLE